MKIEYIWPSSIISDFHSLTLHKAVSEVVYGLGFSYTHHLSRLFKKATGCLPRNMLQ